MKLLISLFCLLFVVNKNTIAKQKYKPTRKGWICKKYNTMECGSGGCCKMVYIYKFPKNIDKMIAENPEFKDEIFKIIEKQNILAINCYGGDRGMGMIYYLKDQNEDDYYNVCYENDKKIKRININNCYKLWKYDPYFDITITIHLQQEMEIECNKIVKKILKKTGKLY